MPDAFVESLEKEVFFGFLADLYAIYITGNLPVNLLENVGNTVYRFLKTGR